ncbi:MAG: TrmH family RNA methyltransferase [Geminicoccaceae bacterium]|nr:TrmH family RNA methyltransferase [Geminicoccaceae bacterium]
MSRLAVVLFETARPHNLGAAIRLCACFDLELHLVEPLGFALSDRRIRETALDYGGWVEPIRHLDAEAFFAWAAAAGRRVVLLDTAADLAYHRAAYRDDDLLLLGNERYGVPAPHRGRAGLSVRIPMAPGRRSLNLVVAGAIVVAEALRQVGAMDALALVPRADGTATR